MLRYSLQCLRTRYLVPVRRGDALTHQPRNASSTALGPSLLHDIWLYLPKVRGPAYSPAECMLRFRETCEIACNLTSPSFLPAYTGRLTGQPPSLSFHLPGQLMQSMLRVSLPKIPLKSWPAHQKCTGLTLTASVANAADIRRRASLTGAVLDHKSAHHC